VGKCKSLHKSRGREELPGECPKTRIEKKKDEKVVANRVDEERWRSEIHFRGTYASCQGRKRGKKNEKGNLHRWEKRKSAWRTVL